MFIIIIIIIIIISNFVLINITSAVFLLYVMCVYLYIGSQGPATFLVLMLLVLWCTDFE